MSIADIPVEAHGVVRARRRQRICELDYRRELVRLKAAGYSQRQLSRWLGLTQPAVQSALATAAKVAMPVEGFSGATPAEICERYAAGFIDREQLVDELVRFPYVPRTKTGGYDSLLIDPPGAWSEVDDATRRGVIEDDVYEEVLEKRHGLSG